MAYQQSKIVSATTYNPSRIKVNNILSDTLFCKSTCNELSKLNTAAC